MDILKIIKEEIDSRSDTLYLIVSDDESSVWVKNSTVGWSFLPTDKVDIETMFRSSFKTYGEAYEEFEGFMDSYWLRKYGTKAQEKDKKTPPKIITIDFLMKQRGDEFPLTESEDFDWIRNVPSYKLGEFLKDYEVCFEESNTSCDIIIEKDFITITVDMDEWQEFSGLEEYDAYYLLEFIRYGGDYDGPNDDYYYYDIDEFNYIGHYMNDQQKERLESLIKIISPEADEDIVDQHLDDSFSILDEYLKYPKLKNMWEDMGYEILHTMGYQVQKNRWLSLGEEYKSILDNLGMEIDTSSISFRYGEDITFTIPTKLTEKVDYNLSDLLKMVSEELTDVSWRDWFYGEWDTSGAEEDISWSFNRFLDLAEDYLEEETDAIEEYENFEKTIKSLGFEPQSESFIKPVGEQVWVLEPNDDYSKVDIKLKEKTWSFDNISHSIIPLEELGEYINNYKLNLEESDDFDWIKEVPGTPKGVTIGPPLSQSNPKNAYRVIVSYGYGEENSILADDWYVIDSDQPKKLVWYLKLIIIIQENVDLFSAIGEMVERIQNGETWILSTAGPEWTPNKEELEDDGALFDILSELFFDIGLKQYNSYYQDDASLENWKVVFFDAYGIPHEVYVDTNSVIQTNL